MALFKTSTYQIQGGELLDLRSPEADDYKVFTEFMQQGAKEQQETLQVPGRVLPEDVAVSRWQQAAEPTSKMSFLAVFEKERIVGMIGLHDLNPGHPWLKHLGYFGMTILREYWGKGLGSYLLECLDAQARQVGVNRIEATVRTKNERAMNLYKKCGYLIEGTRQNAVCIDGNYLDEYYIAKLF